MSDAVTRNSCIVAAILTFGIHVTAAGAAETQRHFPGAGAAVDAILGAMAAGDTAALGAILGPDSEDLYVSGDPVADRNALEQFVEAARARTVIEYDGPDRVSLSVGDDEWPVPTPLLKDDAGWRFDTAAGKEEIINRRIGRNELHAIGALRAFVEAQEAYAAADPTHSGVRQYAQRILSAKGQRDGLYWSATSTDDQSPLAEAVAEAVKEGYGDVDTSKPVPYQGYFFHALTGQGQHAPGGAKSYVADGKMTGGFAFVAWPVNYGNAGIKSFLVNQQGIVFEKDLGAETEKLAAAMTEYDPDDSWSPVEEEEIDEADATVNP